MEKLFDRAEIARRIAELGSELDGFYHGEPLTLVVLVTGGIFFASDLARAMRSVMRIDTLAVSSYCDDVGTGRLNFRSQLKLSVAGRHVLMVDEVLDSGITLLQAGDYLGQFRPLSVHSAVLVEKACPRPGGLAHADWRGFVAPNRYLVGCGMDSHEEMRNLPDIFAID